MVAPKKSVFEFKILSTFSVGLSQRGKSCHDLSSCSQAEIDLNLGMGRIVYLFVNSGSIFVFIVVSLCPENARPESRLHCPRLAPIGYMGHHVHQYEASVPLEAR